MMNCLQSWPEPIIPVQYLSESGMKEIPANYVKRPSDRPRLADYQAAAACGGESEVNIPVIDLKELYSETDGSPRKEVMDRITMACREWGFFQVLNHGVDRELMRKMREAWREFFFLPLEVKQKFANSPLTYEGYGSRLGVEKGAPLDWGDYFFLHVLPMQVRDQNKWPSLPLSCRELIQEYSEQVVGLCGRLMKILSLNLGLKEDQLQQAFGGEDIGACLRANFYPKCPQPDLTLGISPHSDPGGMTILLADHEVSGLQVRRGDGWVTVKPFPSAFIVNLGDQMQVVSNAQYKSVEHRVIVNAAKERVSLAYFYNPKADILIKPADELVTEETPALYPPMTFNDYRVYIRTMGPRGKSQVESLQST